MDGQHKPFDPVVVREGQQRIRTIRDFLVKADDAADALEWFNQYAWGKANPIKVNALPVAMATPGSSTAEAYLKRAAERFADQILRSAIEEAKEHFEAGREAINPKNKG
jgi:hypothetical protein